MKALALLSLLLDSELNEDSSMDGSSSDEDRQQAIQENRELSDQEKYQL